MRRDCGRDRSLRRGATYSAMLTMVNIALGKVPLTACEAGDAGDDGRITVDEILVGCRTR